LPIADKKGPSGKHSKTENSDEASAEVVNSRSQKTSASKNCGKNLSNYWLMKSEPESRLEKGVDVKVRLYLSPVPSCYFLKCKMNVGHHSIPSAVSYL
jgi:hypothetical protein